MDTVSCKAYAKLNLSLIVYRPRLSDGYHPICSVFQAISLYDDIVVCRCSNRDGLSLRVSGIQIPEGESNIITRIYQFFADQLNSGVDVCLTKHIPIGAGLGGGSSDAAAFLLALNQLFELNLTIAQLQKIAAKFGADVPFFLEGGTALVRGIGDKITRIPRSDNVHFVLINPGIHVNTTDIYARYDQQPNLPIPGRTPGVILDKHLGENSFRPIVFDKVPVLRDVERWLLKQGGPDLYLTGTGSTVFIPVASQSAAAEWVDRLQVQFSTCWIKAVQSV